MNISYPDSIDDEREIKNGNRLRGSRRGRPAVERGDDGLRIENRVLEIFN